jgi:hypothetical protein
MSTTTKLAFAAALLAGSVSAAFAGYESFDVDIYRPQAGVQQDGAALTQIPRHVYAQHSSRRVSAPAAMQGPSAAEKAWFDRASQNF